MGAHNAWVQILWFGNISSSLPPITPLQHGQKSPPGQPPSNRRSLHRTLSDESIYRGQRLPSLSDAVADPALGADVLFSCSTLPRSPTTRGVPLRRPSYKLGVKLHGKKEEEGCRYLAYRCIYNCWTSFTFLAGCKSQYLVAIVPSMEWNQCRTKFIHPH